MADKLNLNKATVGDLERISRITRTLAQRIVAVRDRQGGVTNLAALRDINGFTDDLFDILKENGALDVTTDTEKTQLVHVLLDPDQQHKGAYGGYKVTAELVALRTLTGTDSQVAVPQAVNRNSDADGVATLTLPDKPLIQGLVTFTARAPNGEIMARDVRAGDTLSDGVRLPVTPRPQPTTQPTDDPTFNQPRKLRGRVIDREGRMQIANKQVVIWVASKADPEDADYRSVMAAEMGTNGYFSGPYLLGKFTAAHATVALDPNQSVPIHLNADRTMPEEVILVVDAPRRPPVVPGEECQ